MDRNLALEFVRVTEAGAIAASHWVGRGDKNSADGAAVKEMRERFNGIDFDGTVVIGEGEIDEAPMLYIGERIGTKKGPAFDIAIDPLEGTTLTSKGQNGALAVFAAGSKGSLLAAPDMYMDKIAVGPAAKGKVSLDASVADNVKAVAKALGKPVKDVTVAMLDRDRAATRIKELRALGCRLLLLEHGDLAPAVATCLPDSGVDMYFGTGGAPEGVIAAAGVKILGGDFQGRLMANDDEQKARIQKMGLKKPDQLLKLDDLAKGNDLLFVATGVTDSLLLKGVRTETRGYWTHSIVMRAKSGTVRFIEALHAHRKN